MSTINLTYSTLDVDRIGRELAELKEQHNLSPEVFFNRGSRDRYGQHHRDPNLITLSMSGGEDQPLVQAQVQLFPESLLKVRASRSSNESWETSEGGGYVFRGAKAQTVRLLTLLKADDDLLAAIKGKVTIDTYRSLSVDQHTQQDGTEVEAITTEDKTTSSVSGEFSTKLEGLDLDVKVTAQSQSPSFDRAFQTGYIAAKDIVFKVNVAFDQQASWERLKKSLEDRNFQVYDGYCTNSDSKSSRQQSNDFSLYLWREMDDLAVRIKTITEAFGSRPYAFWKIDGSTLKVSFLHPSLERVIHAVVELLPEKIVRIVDGGPPGYGGRRRWSETDLYWNETAQKNVQDFLKLIGADGELARRFEHSEHFSSETITEWRGGKKKPPRKPFKGSYGGTDFQGSVSLVTTDKGKVAFDLAAYYDIKDQVQSVLDKLTAEGFHLIEGSMDR